MKIPHEIKGRHKIRDYKICQLYMQEGMTFKDIGSRFNLTASRCQQIVYNNRNLINIQKDYEKLVRINWLKRQISKKDETRKDTADLIEQLRKEIEGDKPLVDNSTNITKKIEIIVNDRHNANTTSLKPTEGFPRRK